MYLIDWGSPRQMPHFRTLRGGLALMALRSNPVTQSNPGMSVQSRALESWLVGVSELAMPARDSEEQKPE